MSELIPRIYLDFVRGGPPEPLVPVFHHNQMDLRGSGGTVEPRSVTPRRSGDARPGCAWSCTVFRACASGVAR